MSIAELNPEQMARETLTQQLEASAEVCALMRILSGHFRKLSGLPLCEIRDLDIKDALRLKQIAAAALLRTDPEVEARGYEAVAQAICSGKDKKYSGLYEQHPTVQREMRLWAVQVMAAFEDALFGNWRT